MTPFLITVGAAYIIIGLYGIALVLRFRNLLCEACGKRDKTVCKRLDGFLLEIWEKEVEVTWCDACDYQNNLEI